MRDQCTRRKMKLRIRDLAANFPIFAAMTARIGTLGVPIFMFHRVLPGAASWSHPGMVTSTDLFDAFLGFITERFRVHTLEDLVLRWNEHRKNELPPCAITFDDGWLDTFTHAYPLLMKHSVPATVFLPAHFIGTTRYFWQDRLWLMLQDETVREQAHDLLPKAARVFGWSASPGIGAAHLQEFLTARSSLEAEAFVDWMQNETKAESPTARVFMNWHEVREMRGSGIRFGSHSCNHLMLDLLKVEAARREIEQSRQEIESALGERIMSFCYPWRQRGSSVPRLVRDAGYLMAVTTKHATVRRISDAWCLPRIGICSSSLANRFGSFGRNEINLQIARSVIRSYLR